MQQQPNATLRSVESGRTRADTSTIGGVRSAQTPRTKHPLSTTATSSASCRACSSRAWMRPSATVWPSRLAQRVLRRWDRRRTAPAASEGSDTLQVPPCSDAGIQPAATAAAAAPRASPPALLPVAERVVQALDQRGDADRGEDEHRQSAAPSRARIHPEPRRPARRAAHAPQTAPWRSSQPRRGPAQRVAPMANQIEQDGEARRRPAHVGPAAAPPARPARTARPAT
jgi:hypothetical protein